MFVCQQGIYEPSLYYAVAACIVAFRVNKRTLSNIAFLVWNRFGGFFLVCITTNFLNCLHRKVGKMVDIYSRDLIFYEAFGWNETKWSSYKPYYKQVYRISTLSCLISTTLGLMWLNEMHIPLLHPKNFHYLSFYHITSLSICNFIMWYFPFVFNFDL